jgi:hypothetical protein
VCIINWYSNHHFIIFPHIITQYFALWNTDGRMESLWVGRGSRDGGSAPLLGQIHPCPGLARAARLKQPER